MTASTQFKGVLAGLAAVAIAGAALAQSTPPNPAAKDPAVGAGQQSTRRRRWAPPARRAARAPTARRRAAAPRRTMGASGSTTTTTDTTRDRHRSPRPPRRRAGRSQLIPQLSHEKNRAPPGFFCDCQRRGGALADEERLVRSPAVRRQPGPLDNVLAFRAVARKPIPVFVARGPAGACAVWQHAGGAQASRLLDRL